MKAHIVLAHPESNSFNGSLANISKQKLEMQGYEVTYTDLYVDNFDACEGAKHYQNLSDPERFHAQTEQRFNVNAGTTPEYIAAERDRLLQSDVLIVHFPLWWFGMPAILKGWMDRVFVYGSVYKSDLRYDTGICRGKKMIACITTGASQDACSFNGREGDSRLLAWPMVFPFRYIGFDVLEPMILHGIGGIAATEGKEDGLSDIERFMNQWGDVVENIDDRKLTPFNANTDFDERTRLLEGAPVHSPFISHESNSPWE